MEYNYKPISWARSINSFIIQRSPDPQPICAISEPFKFRKHEKRKYTEQRGRSQDGTKKPAGLYKQDTPPAIDSYIRPASIAHKTPLSARFPKIQSPSSSHRTLPPHSPSSILHSSSSARTCPTPKADQNFSKAAKSLHELEETNNRLREQAMNLYSKPDPPCFMQKSKTTLKTLRSQTLCNSRNTIDFIKYNKQVLYNVQSDMNSPRKDHKWNVGIRASPFGRDEELWYSDDMRLMNRTISTPKLGRLHLWKYEGNAALVMPQYPYCTSCRESSTAISIKPN
jgi:hypothetical protein